MVSLVSMNNYTPLAMDKTYMGSHLVLNSSPRDFLVYMISTRHESIFTLKLLTPCTYRGYHNGPSPDIAKPRHSESSSF